MSRFATHTVDTDAATLELGDEFKGAHCLLHAEVFLLLEDLQAARRIEAQTMALPPPSKAFAESHAYVRTFAHQTNRELVRSIRQILMNAPLEEFEMVQIGNLAPATAEEAKQLISSLASRVDDETLQKVLDDVATTRRFEV